MIWSRLVCWCIAAAMLWAGAPLLADHPPAGKIRIVDRPEEDFASIQAAIDVAPHDAVILIGEGRYDERLKITKPVKLIGAGAEKTVIGPTAEVRDARLAMYLARITSKDEEANIQALPVDEQRMIRAREGLLPLSVAIVEIDDVQGVELRSLRVTSPGDSSFGRVGYGFSAVDLKNAGLRLVDCAVVGCLADGVHAEGGSNLEIDDCLIAGCWGVGVRMTDELPSRLKIVNSDIRNCYPANVWTGKAADVFMIEDCRISGSAGFGIWLEGEATIVRNAIFENCQTGVVAGAAATIKQNLFYRNRFGVSCWQKTRSWLEGNLFLENPGSMHVSGASEPLIRRNVFVGSLWAVEYAPEKSREVETPATRVYFVRENLFWKLDRPLVRRDLVGNVDEVATEVIESPAKDKNRVEDPQISLDAEGQIVLGASSPAREIVFAGITSASMKSRWPLTDEERVLVLDDGPRDLSKWKMTTRASKVKR